MFRVTICWPVHALFLLHVLAYPVFAVVEHRHSCHRALLQYEKYEPFSTCPDGGNLLNEIYHTVPCPIPAPRHCVTSLPVRYEAPSSNSTADIDIPGASLTTLRQSAECNGCWNFTAETLRWTKYVVALQAELGDVQFGPHTSVRNMLEIGCGTGGFLLAMSEKRVNGMCITYENLPFAQTTNARGVVAAIMSTQRVLPFPSHSFDMLHAHWVMAYLGTEKEKLARVLLEWDRVVRPGGYIVQRGFWHGNVTFAGPDTRAAWSLVKALAGYLSWDIVEWTEGVAVLDFIAQKPQERTVSGKFSLE